VPSRRCAEISDVSELVRHLFQRRNGEKIFPLVRPSFDFNRITTAESLFELRDWEFHITIATGDSTILEAVSLLVRIAACTGIKKGTDLVIHLKHEVTDALALKVIGIELRNRGLKALRINNDVLGALRGRGIRRRAGT
jgi:hypothetical protein